MRQIFFLEFKIAIRYLFNRTEEGFVSLVSLFSFFGIFIGVSILIIVMSVMNGFREKLIDGILGASGHIKIYGTHDSGADDSESDTEAEIIYDKEENIIKNNIKNYKFLISLIDEFKISKEAKNLKRKESVEIINYYPIIKGQGLISTNNKEINAVYIFGVENVKNILHNMLVSNPNNDFEFSDQNKEKIIIGSRMAESFFLKPTDSVSLISQSSQTSILGDIPNSKDFEIGAIFERKIFDIDSHLIYINIDLARSFFDIDDDAISEIEIYTSNPSKSIILKNELKQFIDKKFYEHSNHKNDRVIDKNIDIFFQKNHILVSDWSEINAGYLNALDIEKKVMLLILSFIICIALFNIISCLIMLVNEKVKSIAILKTMGLYSSSILRIFFYCGSLISFSSVFFGALFGVFISFKLDYIKNFLEYNLGLSIFDPVIYLLKDIPSSPSMKDIFYIIILTILISILMIIPPAIKASRKDPASILKYL
jgi:lipoprotein-releasing system permease protein